MSVAIDASAVLAIINNERGAELAASWARGALLSTVILSEVLAKASDQDTDIERVHALMGELRVVLAPFDIEDALAAAHLRAPTRRKKISYADRACLAVAMRRNLPLITADHDWAELGLNVELRFIRDRR